MVRVTELPYRADNRDRRVIRTLTKIFERLWARKLCANEDCYGNKEEKK